MAPEIAFMDAGSLVEFLRGNWDDIVLLAFTLIQCFRCIIMLFRRKFGSFFMFAPVYFPALVLLAAGLLYNTSWMLLTGYVLGSSLVMSFALWSCGGEDKSVGKIMANGFFTVLFCLHLIWG